MFFVLFCFLSCSEHVLPLRVRHLIVFLRIFSKKNPSRGSSSHFLLYDLPVSGGQPHCCSLLSTPHTLALLMNPLLIFQMASALSAWQATFYFFVISCVSTSDSAHQRSHPPSTPTHFCICAEALSVVLGHPTMALAEGLLFVSVSTVPINRCLSLCASDTTGRFPGRLFT